MGMSEYITVECERCHRAIRIGQYPFCPHGDAPVGRGADVTWPGGKTFENLADQPITFYSPAEQQRYMKAHRIEEFVRHQPVPGSDKSPHTMSWSGISQWQLDGARAMLERGSKATAPQRPDYVASISWETWITHDPVVRVER